MQALENKGKIKEIEGGTIITPKGFAASGVHAGLRKARKDVGVIISDVPAESAAVYTTNQFQAAPLKVTQESIANEKKLLGVIVNSACANACTGEKGLQDAYEMRQLTAAKFRRHAHLFAVASTGVIGEYLKMEKITAGIEKLQPGKTAEHAAAFQTAILTTDTITKDCCFSAEIGGVTVSMGGAAKGSGMIHPNMATMLAFLTTDANIEQPDLEQALKNVTNTTFNQITVDGDTSTNDMVLVMANGLAGNEKLTKNHPDWEVFLELLHCTCESLGKQIARDGEGATKLIEVQVAGSASDEEARMIAKQIVGSNLVKTAVFGADANWGRIISAIGQTSGKVNPGNVDIHLGPITMLKNSIPQPFSEEEAMQYLQNKSVTISVDLHVGECIGIAWGCDLSYEYVKINASYRT
ncbi:bifunctional ornithine acetyltransferase/N-acetylglutamate synthase [Bacillaceae bacterium Marseille-Q3522]|nr:bifunctional ornithine acetyltransferase/N-acetylglutamate synthase [Bacillaceae bacterium Marseille-Q3522]